MSNEKKWQSVERNARDAAHKQELKELQTQLDQFADANRHLQAQLDTALALSRKVTRTVAPIVASPHGSDDSEAVAFAVASDWHVEETVDPRSVNGLNEFNLAIAEARIERFFKNVVRLTEIQRHGTRIDTLVLALLGDVMTGYIHEELQENNGLSPTETVLWAIERITRGIDYLKRVGGFKRIIVPCSYGNHGRTTKKPRHATGAANSYEWMMYRLLANAIPGVEWMVADGYLNYLEVYGRVIRLHHGDNIAYQGGVGGITISVEKAISSWNKSRVADLDIFGHHHTQQQNPKWIANGSLIGYNAYSVAIKAPYEAPQQTYFLWAPERGRTVTCPIHLN